MNAHPCAGHSCDHCYICDHLGICCGSVSAADRAALSGSRTVTQPARPVPVDTSRLQAAMDLHQLAPRPARSLAVVARQRLAELATPSERPALPPGKAAPLIDQLNAKETHHGNA